MASPSVLSTEEAIDRLPHSLPDRAQLVLFAGKRGQGKTTAISRYIETREPRVFALDPFDDFRGIKRYDSFWEAFRLMGRGEPARRVRYVPDISIDTQEWADAFFRRIRDPKLNFRNLLLLLDEISLWSEPHEGKNLKALIMQGRRFGIRICAASQKIAMVPQSVQSEVSHGVFFKMNRPADLETMRKWAGDEAAEAVQHLTPGRCLLLDLS